MVMVRGQRHVPALLEFIRRPSRLLRRLIAAQALLHLRDDGLDNALAPFIEATPPRGARRGLWLRPSVLTRRSFRPSWPPSPAAHGGGASLVRPRHVVRAAR